MEYRDVYYRNTWPSQFLEITEVRRTSNLFCQQYTSMGHTYQLAFYHSVNKRKATDGQAEVMQRSYGDQTVMQLNKSI